MLIVKSFTFNFIQENTYLVYDDISKEAAAIDAGNQFEEEDDQLYEFIDRAGLKVIRLLNTHTHIDHILGNESCSKRFGLIPEFHPEDLYTFEGTLKTSMIWGVDLSNTPRPRPTLKEGDHIALGDEFMSILFTPGHCTGHVAFYCAKQNFIISGDVIFFQSVGRTDLPGGNMQTLIHSIQNKIYTLPPETTIYSGHGEPTSVGYELRHNPFVKL